MITWTGGAKAAEPRTNEAEASNTLILILVMGIGIDGRRVMHTHIHTGLRTCMLLSCRSHFHVDTLN
jgi:hypothetical protein